MIAGLRTTHEALGRFNEFLLAAGRSIAWLMLAATVLLILLQVFFDYVVGTVLSWPTELALALMIWTMGLVAPSAYRRSVIAVLRMVPAGLPRWLSFATTILFVSLATVATALLLHEAWLQLSSPLLVHASGLSGNIGTFERGQLLGTRLELRAAYIYFGMVACFAMMLCINIEVAVRGFGQTVGRPDDFPPPRIPELFAAE